MGSLSKAVALLAVAMLVPTVGRAQTAVTGQVKDSKGHVLPGVKVEVSREINGGDVHAMHLMQLAIDAGPKGISGMIEKPRSAVTDAQGKYRIAGVSSGTYTVVYKSPRFRTLRRAGVVVKASSVAPVNVALSSEIAPQAKALATTQAAAPSTVQDQYSPLVEWQAVSGERVTPIHVSLLPSGALFFMEPFFGMVPSPYNMPPPAAIQIQPMLSPLPGLTYDEATGAQTGKLMTCGGHALMADGNLFLSGGTYVNWNVHNPGKPPQGAVVKGVAETWTYNTSANTWLADPNSIGVGSAGGQPFRWYPTVIRLADSRMMLTGGYELVFPDLVHNRSVDVFDPVSQAWSTISNFTNTPAGIANPDYTHVYQFPSNHLDTGSGIDYHVVLMLGGSAEPLLMFVNGQQSVWRPSGNFRPGAKQYIDAAAPRKVYPNLGSSSAMLPIRLPEDSWGYTNGSLINIGGAEGSVMEGNIDVYDPGLNEWKASIPMSGRRHYSTAIILPDGRILILAGHASQGVDQTGYAEYIDPKNNFSHSVGVAHMPEVRGYHSMVILLPDGRVMVGMGNDDGGVGTEKSNFRYYYPDYMFKKRPEIVSVGGPLKINNYFGVMVPHATNVDEISLLALGSMTHSFDMGQRSVQLRLHSEHFTVKLGADNEPVKVPASECVGSTVTCYDQYFVQAPTSPDLAPPGPYMLFVLDENRVPSQGRMVNLQP